MIRGTTRSKGVAMMLVLFVTALLLIMLGAFVSINQAQFSLLNANEHQAALERTSQSVYEYCYFRLENDKTWAAAKFTDTVRDSEIDEVLLVTAIEGTHTIVGEHRTEDVSYEAVLTNNINGTAAVDGVPVGSCRVDIQLSRGGQSASHRVQFNTAPLYDASAIASKGLTVNSKNLRISSTDPTRNMIRSKEGMRVPQASDLTFNPAAGAAEKGMLWAGDDIRLGTTNISQNEAAKSAAQASTQGRFLDNSKTYYDIHDLQKSELKVAKSQVEINSGLYVFTRTNVSYENDLGQTQGAYVYALERREYTVVDGVPVAGDVKELWYFDGDLPNNQASDSEWVYTDNYSDAAVAHAVPATNFSIDGNNVRADLTNRTLEISANVDVKVDGDFGLFSDQNDLTPNLIFADQDGTADGEVDRGSLSASGEIVVEGNVYGSGKLLADGSVSILPNNVNIATDAESDLSIYSGNNVNIKPPENWDIKNDVSFKGLVYAKNNINVQGSAAQKLSVEGALVAREGAISIAAEEVSLKYNPAYLDSIVKKMPDNRIQLERAVWIP